SVPHTPSEPGEGFRTNIGSGPSGPGLFQDSELVCTSLEESPESLLTKVQPSSSSPSRSKLKGSSKLTTDIVDAFPTKRLVNTWMFSEKSGTANSAKMAPPSLFP